MCLQAAQHGPLPGSSENSGGKGTPHTAYPCHLVRLPRQASSSKASGQLVTVSVALLSQPCPSPGVTELPCVTQAACSTGLAVADAGPGPQGPSRHFGLCPPAPVWPGLLSFPQRSVPTPPRSCCLGLKTGQQGPHTSPRRICLCGVAPFRGPPTHWGSPAPHLHEAKAELRAGLHRGQIPSGCKSGQSPARRAVGGTVTASASGPHVRSPRQVPAQRRVLAALSFSPMNA